MPVSFLPNIVVFKFKKTYHLLDANSEITNISVYTEAGSSWPQSVVGTVQQQYMFIHYGKHFRFEKYDGGASPTPTAST